MRGFVLGVVLTLVALAVAAYAVVATGRFPANADGRPWRLEVWAAHKSLDATLEREAPPGQGPVPLSEQGLRAGLALYRTHCQVCHGGADGKASAIARGLYQPAPQLARHGVEDDPEGATFWKVAHGIRFTGMPAFGRSLSNEQLWQVSLFLKHMDGLPPAVQREWQATSNAR